MQPLYTVLAGSMHEKLYATDFANSEHRGRAEDEKTGSRAENGKGTGLWYHHAGAAHQHRSFVDRPQRGVALREGQVSFG